MQGLSDKTPTFTQLVNEMASGKIRRWCYVLKVHIQIMLLEVPKRGSHPLCGGSKLRWHVSGSFFGMNPRPSVITH